MVQRIRPRADQRRALEKATLNYLKGAGRSQQQKPCPQGAITEFKRGSQLAQAVSFGLFAAAIMRRNYVAGID